MMAKGHTRQGYAKVADLLSNYPELAIFRRFDVLNMQNLLYLQAEITHLESELNELTEHDLEVGENLDHHQDWWTLANDESETAQKQWALVQEIRAKLEAYNDALHREASLYSLNAPSRHNLNFLRSWLERPKMGAFPLAGIDADSWNEEHEHELVSVWPRRQTDVFSTWLSSSVIPTFHRYIGSKTKQPLPATFGSGVFEYSDKRVRQMTRFISSLIASALPLLSVTILYTVKTNLMRMCVITILTSLFSTALFSMTDARGVEVFAATSAFAAINGAYLSNSST